MQLAGRGGVQFFVFWCWCVFYGMAGCDSCLCPLYLCVYFCVYSTVVDSVMVGLQLVMYCWAAEATLVPGLREGARVDVRLSRGRRALSRVIGDLASQRIIGCA